MIKIGIVTCYTNSCNYGAVLQAYALCFRLNLVGYNAEQIRCLEKTLTLSYKQKIRIAIKNKLLLTILKSKMLSFIKKNTQLLSISSKEVEDRKRSFVSFRDSIPHTEIIYTDENLSLCKEFDIYITGSDQVWNIGIENHFSDFYWLNFVPENKKKLSYAASISKSDFPKELYPKVKELLSDYDAISVREKQDKELLDKIIGIDKAQWVLDPTLLLLRNDWEKLCKENPFNGKNYVFVYLLGDNKKQRNFVTKWAKKNNKIVINIPYLLGQYRSCDRKFGDISKSDVTPNLWLSLIRDADCVFTDSFHACVFSSIFHTPFYVFKRSKDTSKYSMNSRIYSLMELYDAEDRIIDDDVAVDSLSALNNIDFDRIDERIEIEREKSLDFLKNALEG